MTDFVALLRAIAHVPMLPFRKGLEELGFTEVGSYGMSGNLLFNAREAGDHARLEGVISKQLGAVALVRTRAELAEVVDANPFAGGAIMFLAAEPDAAALSAFAQFEFESEAPRISGRTVFFVHPAVPRGKRTSIDLERVLGVPGTARSARVVSEIYRRMADIPQGASNSAARSASNR